MAETFTDITSAISGASPFASMRDYLLVGFDPAVVESSTPPNTIEFAFSGVALENCQLVAEYSAGSGRWWPLSFADTTDGGTGPGVVHFEVPRNWAAMSTWDGATEIGGSGGVGTGPYKYWVRLQRRQPDAENVGPVLSSVSAASRPFVVAKRREDPIHLDYKESAIGHTIYFRFVPVGGDGVEHTENEVRVARQIAGTSDDPGNAL